MAQSRSRVREAAAADTPVRTGRMREQLREAPTDGGLGSVVFWTAEDFRAVGQPFYPYWVVVKHHDPLTPALESERPLLLRDLAAGIVR